MPFLLILLGASFLSLTVWPPLPCSSPDRPLNAAAAAGFPPHLLISLSSPHCCELIYALTLWWPPCAGISTSALQPRTLSYQGFLLPTGQLHVHVSRAFRYNVPQPNSSFFSPNLLFPIFPILLTHPNQKHPSHTYTHSHIHKPHLSQLHNTL